MKRCGFQFIVSLGRRSLPINPGFTLLELLVAIAILGILAAITLPTFINLVDETKIDLLTEEVHQSLKEAQRRAISEQQSYTVVFRQTPQGLQVGYSPVSSESNTWQNLSTSIAPDQLIFAIPESENNTIIFTPEGDTQYPSRVFLAMGNLGEPRVNTRRCVNVLNSELGGSYFQVDKDFACDLSPNASPHTQPG